MANTPYSDGAAIRTLWWIVVVVAVICLLGGTIALARRIERKRGLDRTEIEVVRQEAASSFPIPVGSHGLISDLVSLAIVVTECFAKFKWRANVKKVVGFDPRDQNRAEGVIFSFYELRISRTELIKGYQENAQRIRLDGLTATVTKTETVDITIKGPDTNFVYSMPFGFITGGLDLRRARQFAALLNYKAKLQDAPL